MREQPGIQARRLLAIAMPEIPAINPRPPTTIPISPSVFALFASSEADDDELSAEDFTSAIAVSNRGISRVIRSASSPFVGSWTGNSASVGLTTSSKVLGPDVNVSSTF